MKVSVCVTFASLLVTSVGPFSTQAFAQTEVERNVVYGYVSGLALLMDVYHPEAPNGRGIVYLPGSGWHGQTDYSATGLKDDDGTGMRGGFFNRIRDALVAEGFTVFKLNYRLAPTYRYPGAVEDTRRAVRYIRHNADQFGISVEPLGAIGISAGAYFAGMLALQDGFGNPDADDPIERNSAKVQAAVAYCGFLDLTIGPQHGAIVSFLGVPRSNPDRPISPLWVEASPVTYLSEDDPPFLLINAKDDPFVAFETVEGGAQKLRDAGLDVETMWYDEGGHCGPFDMEATVDWFVDKLSAD